MDTLEKAELNASIPHIAVFLKSGKPIYNSQDRNTAARKRRRRRRTHAIAKRYTLHANAINFSYFKKKVITYINIIFLQEIFIHSFSGL